MPKKIIYLILIALVFQSAQGQILNSNPQILVYGTVVDEYTGTPMKLKVEFRAPNKQKFVVQTDQNGEFKQLLNSNTTYELIFKRYDVFREKVDFTTDTASAFREDTVQISCKLLQPETKLFKFNMFDGSGNISQDGKDNIKKLKKTMRMNRSLHFDLIVNGSSQATINQRKQALAKELESFGSFNKKINVKSGSSSDHDMIVQINKVEEPFR